jgi:ATP-dependent DNA helicase RecG
VLEEARSAARRILAQDPALERHPHLREALDAQRRRSVEAAQLN